MQVPPWSRRDTWAAALVAALTGVSRIAVRTTSYSSYDAGTLALGTRSYEFATYQPHPPYYPLVVFLAKPFAFFLGELAALTWLSILASVAMVAATYAFARRLAGPWTSVAAAGLLVASPLALANGSVPLGYALEGAASVLVAWAAWTCRRAGDVRSAILLGAVVSLAVGLRPSAIVLLGPIAPWAVWGRTRPMRAGATSGAVVTLAWLIPALVAGGGVGPFLEGLAFQSRFYVLADPVWSGGAASVASRAEWLAHHARHEGAFLLSLLAACTVTAAAWRPRSPSGTAPLLVAWLAPGLLFYLLVYAGWPVHAGGYLMALLPPIAILAAFGLRNVVLAVTADGVPKAAKAIGLLASLIVAGQAAVWPAAWDDATKPARRSEAWESGWAGLEDAFPANETALVSEYGVAWARLRHPDHLLWSVEVFAADDGRLHTQVDASRNGAVGKGFFPNLRDGTDDAPHAIPSWVRRIVVVDGHPQDTGAPLIVPGVSLHEETLPGGRRVTWFDGDAVATIEEALAFVQAGPVPYDRRPDPPA